ncbi:MAG: 30S ribosome-binding factor RbfA [Alphaproteobacteria bacterium]|nr:MAG: 30S ribosome-binding factor RbfA [Alphaproteobacteria bacterium]
MSRRPSAAGPSPRALRVGEVIRRVLSEILTRGDLHDPALSRPVTVGEVRMSPDLRHATVYVLPLGGAGVAEVLAALDRHRPALRRAVAASVRLKYAPELRFLPDELFDRMDAVRRLMEDEAVRRDLDGAD